MNSKIDWNNNREQISGAYILTDKQVKEGLLALDHAYELYGNYEDDNIPECIMLFDNNNTMVHKIKTHTNNPCTVEVRPKKNKLVKIVVCTTISITFALYIYNKYNSYI